MTINSLDTLLAAFKPGYLYQKPSVTSGSNADKIGLFKATGTITPAGATPPAYTAGSGYTCDNTTKGGLPFVNPSGDCRLARMTGASTAGGYIFLYDRLWACSGFSSNITTLQSITTPGTLPARDVNGSTAGVGLWIALEIHTAPGASSCIPTVTYVNSSGVNARTSANNLPISAYIAPRVFWLNLQAGDEGVSQLTSLQFTGASGTAGDIGLAVIRPIAVIPVAAGSMLSIRDWQALALPKLYSGTCLGLSFQAVSNVSGHVSGMVHYARE